jgi:hypothetical protein
MRAVEDRGMDFSSVYLENEIAFHFQYRVREMAAQGKLETFERLAGGTERRKLTANRAGRVAVRERKGRPSRAGAQLGNRLSIRR